eukprot:12907307-Prorocentrum_lima.AAC.1
MKTLPATMWSRAPGFKPKRSSQELLNQDATNRQQWTRPRATERCLTQTPSGDEMERAQRLISR